MFVYGCLPNLFVDRFGSLFLSVQPDAERAPLGDEKDLLFQYYRSTM